MNKRKLNKVEQLAVAQAVYKMAAEKVSTKSPGNLRSEVDETYKALYESTGAKTFEVRMGGEKVGRYTVKEKKPKVQLKITDIAELLDWCEANDYVLIKPDMDRLNELFSITGEIPPGCDIEEIPGGYGGGSLSIKVDDVSHALGGLIPFALLGGGDGDGVR